MKCVLLITFLAIGAHGFFTPEQVEVARTLSEACVAEVGEGLPENVGDRFRQGDATLTDDKSKCYMRCIFSRVGFLNAETGEINKATLSAKLTKGNGKEKAEKFAEKCGSFEGENACQKAFGLYRCYFDNKAEYFD